MSHDEIACLTSKYGSYECMPAQAAAEIRRLERKTGDSWILRNGLTSDAIEAALVARDAKRAENRERRFARQRAAMAAYFAEQARFDDLAAAALAAGDMAEFAVQHRARLAHRDAFLALIGGK